MSKIVLMCIVTFLFSGCVSHHAYFETMTQLVEEGKCDEAMQHIYNHDEIPFDFQMLQRGMVYQFCYKDMKRSADYYALSARYDNKTAIELLVSRGLPVPAADLVNTSRTQGEAGWADIIGAAANAKLKGK